jgi:threonine dehydrogenase-like Zn-dependent dehydrogenase
VFGAGPIGLVCLLVAKAFGAEKVVITDIAEERLELARKLGAFAAINVKGLSEEQVAEKITRAVGAQVDASIDW